MAKDRVVVILGGSLAGLAVAHHRLLKYTLPHQPDLRVVLISKNSHFYWNLASVRAVIPGLLRDDQLLQPIAPGLQRYPADHVDFILGSATGLDTQAKTVQVTVAATSDHRTISYDYLVLATGADSADPSMPWKASGSYEDCLASLHGTAARIDAARHVVIAGGGPTGVEVAAEVKYAFPDKTVILLSGGAELVGGDASAAAVERELRRLGVDVRKGLRSTAVDADRADGSTHLTLSNGETLVTDCYLPTIGLAPNTAFLPRDLLTEKGYVDVDECMRVRAAADIWAAGDVVSQPRAGFLYTESQAAGVAKNIQLVLEGKEQRPVSGPPVDAFICSIGRGRGAGRLGFLPLPSFLVWAFKGRTLGMERTPKYVDGSMW